MVLVTCCFRDGGEGSFITLSPNSEFEPQTRHIPPHEPLDTLVQSVSDLIASQKLQQAQLQQQQRQHQKLLELCASMLANIRSPQPAVAQPSAHLVSSAVPGGGTVGDVGPRHKASSKVYEEVPEAGEQRSFPRNGRTEETCFGAVQDSCVQA